MKKFAVTLLGVAFLPLLVVSCSGGSGGGAQAEDTPEMAAFEFRHGVMHAIAWKVTRLRAMAQGDMPVNDAEAVKDARDVEVLAGMIPEGFIPNSIVQGSSALPEIWMNMDDFHQKAMDLQNAAKALADAASQNGFEASKGMVQAVGQTCGGCHRPYRRRQE